ncbi:MAG TPA: SDR family NAD(P)-dependent oxidoreductase [Blastocatellia bacterium]
MELKGKRILVTGATGFIGGHLVERLAQMEGARVTALSRSAEKLAVLAPIAEQLVQGDVTDPAAVRRAVDGCEIVFHCAGLMHDGAADLDRFMRVNVDGTRNVLEAALDLKVERAVHLSSIAVYGIDPADGTNEKAPYRSCGMPYFDSKIRAETVAWSLAKRGLPLVVIRPANVYGPRSSFWTLGLLMMIKAGEIQLIGGGRGASNHLYVGNLIDAMILAAQNDSVMGESFIVTDGQRTPWSEFLGYYVRMLGLPELPSISKEDAYLEAARLKREARPGDPPPALSDEAIRLWTQTGVFDITATRQRLGYAPRVPLNEGMKITEQWLRESGHLR